MLSIILLVFAFVFFAIATAYSTPNPEPPWRSRLVCCGLACWVLSELVAKVPLLLR